MALSWSVAQKIILEKRKKSHYIIPKKEQFKWPHILLEYFNEKYLIKIMKIWKKNLLVKKF
jgi:hypothetical protein